MKIKSVSHPDNKIEPPKPFRPEEVDLPDGLYLVVRAYCRSCGNSYTYDCEIEDFDPDMSYCGRSDRCIP